MSHKEEVKLNDFKAQYNSILGNIRDVNNDLKKIIDEKDKQTIYLQEINDLIAKAEDDLKTIIQRQREAEALTKGKREEEKKLSKLLISFKFRADKENEKLDHQRLIKSDELLRLQRRGEEYLADLRSEEADIKESIGIHNSEVIDLNEKIEELKDVNEKLTELNGSLDRESDKLAKELIGIRLQIKDANDELEEALKVTKNPLIELKNKEDSLKKLRRDLKIWHTRLKRAYESMFPGRVFRVELYDE